jgi:hypothetical protein
MTIRLSSIGDYIGRRENLSSKALYHRLFAKALSDAIDFKKKNSACAKTSSPLCGGETQATCIGGNKFRNE